MIKLKKIIPVISVIGASALTVGIGTLLKDKVNENFIQYFNSFQNDANNYMKVDAKQVSTALNKYTMTIETELDQTDEQPNKDAIQDKNDKLQDNAEILPDVKPIDQPQTLELTDEDYAKQDEQISEDAKTAEDEQISTLYYLSNDITENCDAFCELKEKLHDAILETQTLISKVKNKEITLTEEQRLFITEQAQQLKHLGRELSNYTTTLTFSLTNLNELARSGNQNLDELSLKYMVVLDNLVNGNEMLQYGLNILRLMNQMFSVNTENIPANNHGRVLYGFQQNNNPPVVKDYYIDENNNLQENKPKDTTNNEVEQKNNGEITENVDTYQNNKLQSNIDTYQNSPVNRNIDTFFNTALLDNEFMYGNGYGAGFGGGLYGANPNMGNYMNYERDNTRNGVNNNYTTQNNGDTTTNPKKDKFRLKKNIDTYRDDNTPDLKGKLENIKSNIGDFFSKFSKSDLDDKIDNPIYKYDGKENVIK